MAHFSISLFASHFFCLRTGDTDIVRRGFSPRIIEEPPILSQAALLEVMGLKSMPKMEDVTGEAPSE